MNQECGQLQPKQLAPAAAGLDADYAAESSDYLEVLLMPKSAKKRLPTTCPYYCSRSPSRDLDENPVREDAEALITHILEAESLEQAKAGAAKLKAMSQRFLNWTNKAEWLSFEVLTLPPFVHQRLSIKAIIETLKNHKKGEEQIQYAHQAVSRTLTEAPLHFQYSEHPKLQEIFRFIEANYHKPIGLTEIAQAFGYTPSYLTSLVRRLTGQTVYQWIIQRRMFQARHLLLETDLAVQEVAEAVGYVDTGHFVKHFRKLHRVPPKKFSTSAESRGRWG
jgi:AraC-like DNA-binding protein